MTQQFPILDPQSLTATRAALHSYAKILGDCLKATRPKRKHWWHASLRPSLRGLSTGTVHGPIDFELELDLFNSRAIVSTASGSASSQLNGQSDQQLATWLGEALANLGVRWVDRATWQRESDDTFPDYSFETAHDMQQALSSITGALTAFRAGIREESSPVQVWPHHFDLSMIWLPGVKVPGEDPANEEYADKQMNFGFAFGDESFDEPYFYVTAYPMPDPLRSVSLLSPARWHTVGFNGAVALYGDLAASSDPSGWLQEFWSALLAGGLLYLDNKR